MFSSAPTHPFPRQPTSSFSFSLPPLPPTSTNVPTTGHSSDNAINWNAAVDQLLKRNGPSGASTGPAGVGSAPNSSNAGRMGLGGMVPTLINHLVLPFLNGLMLGFGEIAAREIVGHYFGWGPSAYRYYQRHRPILIPPTRTPEEEGQGDTGPGRNLSLVDPRSPTATSNTYLLRRR